MAAYLLRLLAWLPLPWLHRLGSCIGWLIDRSSPRFSARLTENLVASGLAADPPSLARLRRRVVAELGKAVLELPAIWLRQPEEVDRLVRRVRGWEHVEAARGAGRGILFLTPHLGCFEIAALHAALRVPITVLYRPPKLRWLAPVMQAGRSRGYGRLVPTNLTGVRHLLKALKAGEAVGLLPDQVPGFGEGQWAPFFGRPALTMTLAGRLQQATGCEVLLAVARRLPGGAGYELDIEVLAGRLDGPEGVARLNAAIERLVRHCPEQYLWSYNRYKVPAGAKMPAAGAGEGV